MDQRIIFHIDVNNAFLSWTAVKLLNEGYKIDIRTIPSVIGGDESKRQGIVLAKSPIAKKLGIKTAETLYMARKKCPNVKIYPPDYEYYWKTSQKLFTYLNTYSPSMEQMSVDECFLDMSNMHYIYNDLETLAYKIKDDIKNKFGFTVNIGIANNKLCAKMASDFKKPNKVHTLYEYEVEDKMWPLSVEDLFMVGKKSSEKLRKLNINTIGDLAHTDKDFLKRTFGIFGETMWEYANGVDNSEVTSYYERDTKSISTSQTLEKDSDNLPKLKRILLAQTEKVCRSLRKQGMYARTVGITIKSYNFHKYSKQSKFDNATNTTEIIYKKIIELFNNCYKGEKIRNIGVRVTDFTDSIETQISLFDTSLPKKDKISPVLDDIKDKFGDNIIRPASLYENIGDKNGFRKN